MARAVAGTPPESRSRLMIIAAVVFAAVAALLLFVALQNRGGEEAAASAPLTREVVVAGRNIEANTVLTADMLEVKSVPVDQTLRGVYSDAGPLVGVPVRYPLQKGEQISTSKVGLEQIEDEKDISLVLKPGQRGFSIYVSEVTSVGGLLLPGNFVDVIAVFPEGPAGLSSLGEFTSIEDLQDIKAITLLQDIEVLGVAQEAQEPVVPAAPTAADDADVAEDGEEAEVGEGIRGQRSEDVERQPKARSATLAVTPEQAQLLALVEETNGIIWLSLRPVGDHESLPPIETNLLPLLSSPPPQP